ncbi:MAG: YkvA family protein [Akkermansiaceae bacterium]|jgi:uncharacterized membrane protein YkvA (DUF1232 family)|nr:YkvA family protein [Akkermansiaceae bacterium]
MSTKKVPAKKVILNKSKARKTAIKATATNSQPAKEKATSDRTNMSSPQVLKAFQAASSMLADTTRFKRLVSAGVEKISTVNPDAFTESWAYLTAMVRLLSAYRRGEYREVPWKSLVTIGGAVIYVVNPFDLIPDAVPVAGLSDDAAVVSFALKTVKIDLDRFMAWETTR